MTRCFFGGEGSFGGPTVICSAGVAALCSKQAGFFAAAAADLGMIWDWVVGAGLRLMPGLWPEPCTAAGATAASMMMPIVSFLTFFSLLHLFRSFFPFFLFYLLLFFSFFFIFAFHFWVIKGNG